MSESSEWNAGRVLGTSTSYWQSCTLHAGVKLDLFTQLSENSLSAEDLAAKLDCDVRGLTALLNALTAMGLLDKQGSLYSNTNSAKSLLVRGTPQYVGHIIMHHHYLVDAWAQLSQAVKKGAPVEKKSHGEETERESFLMGMYNIAMANAPKVAMQIDLAGRQRLLDLGGGPGTYAIHFALANPSLKATIFDRPTTEPYAMKTVAQFGLERRIKFQAGDFTVDPIKGRYDVAWLSQILHSNGPADCQQIIAKTKSALQPGGLIMIHEFFLNDNLDGPLFPALFSLNMLLNNPQGRSYSEKEIRDMLSKAGVKKIHCLPFQGSNDSYIVCGTV